MYSIVLMTALATASSGPSFGNRHGCCYAYAACHSCYGGSGCYGCHRPVYGYGAAGGCYGYHGGCYSAFGVVHADPYYGGCTGCYGAYGGHSCYGIPVPVTNVPAVKAKDPFPPINPEKKKGGKDPEEVAPPKEKKKPDSKDDKVDPKKPLDEGVQARAKVRIDVPQGGKLFVDGRQINVTPGIRTFQTPVLTPGEAYYYDIRIEVVMNGVFRQEERRVIVRSGQEAAVSFQSLAPPGTDTAHAPR